MTACVKCHRGRYFLDLDHDWVCLSCGHVAGTEVRALVPNETKPKGRDTKAQTAKATASQRDSIWHRR